ncbi:hypothetical protein LCGC14_0728710 [marine sediment metagenome]|uniref:Aspartyl protease n=1 Tax=marine sediment metagenome TaxID=412755 RepID=A0A0F9QAB2_9ZZZZ|nr:MAG: hypothetical protein Lokiarch_00350 [Candidatus Lokiarchaeum sp. GC14_75]
MNILGGWKLDPQLQIYRIPVRISNPETKVTLVKYCIFDTGFTGYFGLDKESIKLLNLPKIGRGKGVTVSGLIEYDNYNGIVEIVDQEQRTIIKILNKTKQEEIKSVEIIPIQEFGIPIIGIKSICQISWLILSEREAIFILK